MELMQHQVETGNGAELTPRVDAEGKPLVAAPAGERPAWLPENFKTPEDFAKSYSELQAAHTQANQAAAKGAEPAAAEAPAAADADAAAAATKVQDDMKAQGVDVEKMSATFWETGEVAAADRDAIKASSPWVTDEMITSFAAGQQALASARTNEVLAPVGGQAGFDELSGWAKENWTEAQITSINKVLAGSDLEAAKLALSGLKSAKESAVGSDPARHLDGGKPGAATGDVYANNQQLQADMKDPRYKVDEAYRQVVQAKLMRSSI